MNAQSLKRRLRAIEQERDAERMVRYTVSDRCEWDDEADAEELSPVISEAVWIERYGGPDAQEAA